MPLYMDIHTCEGASVEDVAKAHVADMDVQDRYDVEYKKYWFNESCGKLFCLVEAPSAEAAQRVHQEAHGLVAEKFIEIDPELVDSYMGQSPVSSIGAALVPGATRRHAARHRSPHHHVHRHRRFDRIDVSGSATNAAMAMLAIHDRIVRDALRGERRARGQAYRRRDHGVVHLGRGSGAWRLRGAKGAARP